MALGRGRQMYAFVDGQPRFWRTVVSDQNPSVHNYLLDLRMDHAGMIATANANVTSAKHSWKARASLAGPWAPRRHSSSTARTLTPTAPPNWRTKLTDDEA